VRGFKLSFKRQVLEYATKTNCNHAADKYSLASSTVRHWARLLGYEDIINSYLWKNPFKSRSTKATKLRKVA